MRASWWLLTGWAGLWTVGLLSMPHGFGWHYFVLGADQISSLGALQLFTDHPELQSGPATFLLLVPLVRLLPAGTAYDVACVAMAAAGLIALRLADATIAHPPVATTSSLHPRPHAVVRSLDDRMRLFIAGVVIVPVWSELAVRWSHPDDVLAVLSALAGLCLLRRDRPLWAALALASAVDFKPWAVVFLPLPMLTDRPRRLAAAGVAAAVVAAAWAPFVIADPATLTAVDYTIRVSSSSVVHLFGVDGRTPTWCRPAQLLLGLTVVAVAVRRGRWQLGMLGGIAARLLLDPATKSYYIAGIVVAGYVADLRPPTRVPVLTLLTVVALYAAPIALGSTPTVLAILRLVVYLALLAFVVGPQAEVLRWSRAPKSSAMSAVGSSRVSPTYPNRHTPRQRARDFTRSHGIPRHDPDGDDPPPTAAQFHGRRRHDDRHHGVRLRRGRGGRLP